MKDVPGGPVVKNLPCNADTGSIPGQGTKIPYATEQLSHVPQLESPELQRNIPHDTIKILSAATKTQGSQINK